MDVRDGSFLRFCTSYKDALPILDRAFGLAPERNGTWTSESYETIGVDSEGYSRGPQDLRILHLVDRSGRKVRFIFDAEGHELKNPKAFFISADDPSFETQLAEYLETATFKLGYEGLFDLADLHQRLTGEVPEFKWRLQDDAISAWSEDPILLLSAENVTSISRSYLQVSVSRAWLKTRPRTFSAEDFDAYARAESLSQHSVFSVRTENLQKYEVLRSRLVDAFDFTKKIDLLVQTHFGMKPIPV